MSVCLSVSYAILTEETWRWRGNVVDGIRHLMAAVSMEPDQWQLGQTKVFVKNPESVSGGVGSVGSVHVVWDGGCAGEGVQGGKRERYCNEAYCS